MALSAVAMSCTLTCSGRSTSRTICSAVVGSPLRYSGSESFFDCADSTSFSTLSLGTMVSPMVLIATRNTRHACCGVIFLGAMIVTLADRPPMPAP